jgi:hypothetical protein
MLSLAACNRGNQSNEAVRQGVIDYLGTKVQLNVAAMDVGVTSVKFEGKQAEATVTIKPKVGGPEQAMTMGYKLEQQGSKWVVLGRNEAGGAQHGTMPPAAAPNPHGGDPGAAAGGAGKMPSPDDLPPAGKK